MSYFSTFLISIFSTNLLRPPQIVKWFDHQQLPTHQLTEWQLTRGNHALVCPSGQMLTNQLELRCTIIILRWRCIDSHAHFLHFPFIILHLVLQTTDRLLTQDSKETWTPHDWMMVVVVWCLHRLLLFFPSLCGCWDFSLDTISHKQGFGCGKQVISTLCVLPSFFVSSPPSGTWAREKLGGWSGGNTKAAAVLIISSIRSNNEILHLGSLFSFSGSTHLLVPITATRRATQLTQFYVPSGYLLVCALWLYKKFTPFLGRT